MRLLTNSFGILRRKESVNAYFLGDVRYFSILSQFLYSSNSGHISTIIGWGNKPNTQKIKAFAREHNVPYLHLEDGFIGYLGHPANKGVNIGLVVDEQGIYYDASAPSDIENHIVSPLNSEQLARANSADCFDH